MNDPAPGMRRLRALWFVRFLLASIVAGAVHGISAPGSYWEVLLVPAFLACYITYAICVHTDLRLYGSRGFWLWLKLLVSLVPFWGLGVYLLWTRRLLGLLVWLPLWLCVISPGAAAYVLARALSCLWRGGPF